MTAAMWWRFGFPILMGVALLAAPAWSQADGSKLARALERATELERTGNTAEATSLVGRILDKYPENVTALCLLAKLKLKEKDVEGAEEAAALAFGLSGGQDAAARKMLDEVRTFDPAPAAISLGTLRKESGGYPRSSAYTPAARGNYGRNTSSGQLVNVQQHADGSASGELHQPDGTVIKMVVDDNGFRYEGYNPAGFTFKGEGKLKGQ